MDRIKIKKAQTVYLDVIMRIPVRVIDDDRVSSGQVDAQTPRPC